MTTETINIIVQENGSRVVKRALEDIGSVAERSVRGLRLLQNSLFVLGGAGLVSSLVRMLDTITSFENRLRLVTKTNAELNEVQDELFNIASRTRTAFESTAEVYNRAALAVRHLGLSQRETLAFTESLNKATILSGANSREAEAALIQLSQGLASGRLNGDELRSILEQLPYVADIIGKELVRTGIIAGTSLNSAGEAVDSVTGALFNTRGEMRRLGAEGKIASDVIIDAFRNAEGEIAKKFAETIPTIGQSLSVLRNEFLRLLDQFDDSTGASALVARAIISIAVSLKTLVAGLIAAGLAFGSFKLTSYLSALSQGIKLNRQMSEAVKAGNLVLLNSVSVEKAKAASSLATAAAESAVANTKVRQLQLGVAQLTQNAALIRQQRAQEAFTVTNGRARSVLTGQYIALNTAVQNNIRSNRALALTEQALVTTKSELSAATALQTTTTNALVAAQGRSAAANVVAGTFTSRLTAAFPLLGNLIGIVSNALRGLWAIMAANPVGATIAALVALIGTLTYFSDQIGIAGEDVVTLRDVGIATFQLIGEAIAPVTNYISESFSGALNLVSGYFSKFWEFTKKIFALILNDIKNLVNFTIGLFVGLVNSIIKVFDILPAAIQDVAAVAINLLVDTIKTGIQGVVRAIGDLLEFVGGAAESVGLENPFKGYFDNFKFTDLDQFKREVTGAAREVGGIINKEFGSALDKDYVGDAWGAILERARLIAAERLADLDKGGKRPPPRSPNEDLKTKDSKKKDEKTFADIVKELTIENELLKLNASEREKIRKIIQIEKELKEELTASEIKLIRSLLDENEILKKAAEIFDELAAPADEYQLTLIALNKLLAEGSIKQEEFNKSLRKARIEFLDSRTDMAAGLERGFLRILENTGDYAKQMESIVTNAFDGMSSAIADLVVDGEADFGSLIKSINKQIVQLVVSQAFQQLFKSNIGGTNQAGGTNIFSGLFKGLGGLFGFQKGGSFNVGSNTGIAPLPGVDNRLVAFRAKDGENVTVTPKGRNPGGTEQFVTVNFNVSTPDVEGFRRSEDQLSLRAAKMINRARRNS